MSKKVVVTRATLLDMAQRCARGSQKRSGHTLLDDAASLLEEASFRVADLENRVEEWETFGALLDAKKPKLLSPKRTSAPEGK